MCSGEAPPPKLTLPEHTPLKAKHSPHCPLPRGRAVLGFPGLVGIYLGQNNAPPVSPTGAKPKSTQPKSSLMALPTTQSLIVFFLPSAFSQGWALSPQSDSEDAEVAFMSSLPNESLI